MKEEYKKNNELQTPRSKSLRVLHIEDSENDTLLLLRELRKGGYDPVSKRVDTEEAMSEAIENDTWDIIISDYSMPQFNGLAALKSLQKYDLDIPFIVISGTIGEDVAVAAMKAGAHDYLMKGNLARLIPAMDRELRDAKIRRTHKQSLEKLCQSERIVASSSDMMALIDKNFVYLSANDAYLKAFGKTSDQILGHSMPELFGEDFFKTIIKPRADLCLEGKDVRYHYWLDLPIHGRCYMDAAYTPYRGENNVINGFVVISRDITEIKRTQDALLESEMKYKLLADNTVDCIWMTNMDMLFIYINPAIYEMTGFTVEEWVGSKLQEHCDEKNFEKMAGIILSSLEELSDNKGFTFEAVMLKKNGDPFHVEIAGKVLLDEEKKPVGLQGVTRDITERKQAEKGKKAVETQLHQSQKFEAIGTLAGGIAHDFNNILSAIIGFTELSFDDAEKGSHIEDNLQEIYSAGKRAKDLVNQILAYARQSEEELKPIQVDIIIKEVLKFIRSTTPTTIEINQNINSDSLIMGNSTHVHQILMNLCTNAAHAMEDKGGIIEVNMKDVVIDKAANGIISDLKQGNYLEIEVSDTGTGIAPEIIGSIFEPYFTTKDLGKGTGMGLAMVHGICESYGGKITVKSLPGQGTLFTVHLPVSKKRQKHTPYESEILPTGTERILFIDDEEPITRLGSQILKQLGYSVETKNGSEEALELFRLKPDQFDLIITDMNMPKMSGDRLAAEMISIRADIPVILCTGFSNKISDENAAEFGIKGFAYKPVVKADLAKTVRKVLDETKSSTQ